MREETKIYKIYKFEELSPEAQQKAIEGLFCINVEHDWWESVYSDAETVGLKILAFDTDRGSYCEIDKRSFSGVYTAELILKNHGQGAETFKEALNFLADCATYSREAQDFEDAYDIAETFEERESEFLKALSEEYLSMLRKEYEYLTSEDAIKEMIEANDYEFTEDGKLY